MRHLRKAAPGAGPEISAASCAGPDRIPDGRPFPRRARRGLINVILTVAIVAVVVVGLLLLYGGINRSIKAQTLQTHFITAEAAIRRAYASAPQYPTGPIHNSIRSQMPSNAIRGSGATRDIVTPWGGEITAGAGTTPGTSTTASDTNFWILAEGVPAEACYALATSYLRRDGVDEVQASSTGTATWNVVGDVASVEQRCGTGRQARVAIVFRG